MKTNKPWERPWSMDEIINHSEHWTMAGDVALLNTIKAFGDNVLTKTNEMNSNLHALTSDLNETSLRLDIARNEFQSLRNTQFIESRVYEDDETLPRSGTDDKPKNEEKSDEAKTEDIRFALMEGFKVLNQYFDKVPVTVSDSDDDDEVDANLPNYVLRPKDLYLERPLPYVIGSDEWYKSAHVGLDDDSSSSSTDEASEKFSESDPDDNLPGAGIKDSDVVSELDLSQLDNRTRSGSDASAKTSSANFAEQLAERLGDVVGREPEVNTRPIQTKSQYGDLFLDEPPPLDDDNKGMFSGGKGLFDDDDGDAASGRGLFDEDSEAPAVDEDVDKKKPVGGVSLFGGDLFAGKLPRRRFSSDDDHDDDVDVKTVEESKKFSLFDSDDEDGLFGSAPSGKQETSSKSMQKLSLFHDDDAASDEHQVQQSAAGTSTKAYDDSKKRKTLRLFDDEAFGDEHQVPKIVAGTSTKANDDLKKRKTLRLFDDDDESLSDEHQVLQGDAGTSTKASDDSKKRKTLSLDEATGDEHQVRQSAAGTSTKANDDLKKRKTLRLFDDDDESLSDEHQVLQGAAGTSTKANDDSKLRKTLGLFDDDEDETAGDEHQVLQSAAETSTKANDESKKRKTLSLFDDDDDEALGDEHQILQGAAGTSTKANDESKKRKPLSLFDDDDDEALGDEHQVLQSAAGTSTKANVDSKLKKTLGLFDDDEDEAAGDEHQVRQSAAGTSTKAMQSLFDDDETMGAKKPISIFDDADDEVKIETSEHQVKKIAVEAAEVERHDSQEAAGGNEHLEATKQIGLFDDDDDEEAKLASGAPKQTGLFDEDDDDDLFKNDLFSKATTSNISEQVEQSTSVLEEAQIKPHLSLFDSPPPEPDDLFADHASHPSEDLFADELFASTPKKQPQIDKNRLFDASPPPDDGDDVEHKSDTLSECDDLTTDDTSPIVKDPAIGFIEEPPPSDEPQVVKPKPGKLTHNLNINVGALLPGASPRKASAADDEVEVLTSVTKDRARVRLPRRPSTRKGRQAALRSSISEFTLKQDVDKVEDKLETEVEDTGAKTSMFDDRAVLRSSASDFTLKLDVDKVEDKLEREAEDTRAKSSLFDDEDDDDLFSGKKAMTIAPRSIGNSLFDDDDDDIFKSVATVSGGAAKKVQKKIAKANVRKLENTTPDDDPLSAFLK